uniref:Uncharacterized protein n=1 Tax=Onchocerca volvulus TaxID=6282 RepID=A0A8R1XSJ9_ONCVO
MIKKDKILCKQWNHWKNLRAKQSFTNQLVNNGIIGRFYVTSNHLQINCPEIK